MLWGGGGGGGSRLDVLWGVTFGCTLILRAEHNKMLLWKMMHQFLEILESIPAEGELSLEWRDGGGLGGWGGRGR